MGGSCARTGDTASRRRVNGAASVYFTDRPLGNGLEMSCGPRRSQAEVAAAKEDRRGPAAPFPG